MLEAGIVSGFVAGLSIGLGVAFLARRTSDGPEKTTTAAKNDDDEWEDQETESEGKSWN